MKSRKKVYVINDSPHDFSDAERFGELIFLSEGIVNKFAANNIARSFERTLAKSSPEDYLLLTGLSIMCSIASAIFAAKHGRLNLLLFRDGKYVERRLNLLRKKEN